MPALKEDFKLIALIIIGGFALLSLTATILINKKINYQFLSIKNAFLEFTAKLGLHSHPTNQDTQDAQQTIKSLLIQSQKKIIERQKKEKQQYYNATHTTKMKALVQLSTGMAHEISNPLAAILGHAQLAKGKSTNPQIQNHLDIVEKEIRKISEFVRNLMKFTQNIPSESQAFNINQVISETMNLMEQQLASKGILIKKHLMSTQDIYGSAHHLQQVLINLINNAEYAMEKSHTKILSIHTEDFKNSLRIQVRDTGPGIASDIKERIFEPFFTTKTSQEELGIQESKTQQLASKTLKTSQGYGLGLFITYNIVQEYKGHITVESEPNKGTTFIIDLPYQKPHHLQTEQKNIPHPKSVTLQANPTPSNQKVKIPSLKKDYLIAKNQAIDKKNLTNNINPPITQKQQIKPSHHNIDFQINHLKPKQNISQKHHFAIAKHDVMKSLDFKVKIRPAKMKNLTNKEN